MSENTQCEVCQKELEIDSLTGKPKGKSFKRFDLLCNECYVKESTAFINKAVQTQVIIPQQQPDITKREEFFTAEVESIQEITGTPMERATKIRERITSWRMILFEAQCKEYKAYQVLQELATQLSKEEKDKLQIQDVSYTPSTVTSKPKATKEKINERMSKEDKALLQMATIVYGAKLNKLDEVNVKCFKEHPDWWSNGAVIYGKQKEYDAYVTNNGAMTKKQAIEAIKDSVRGAKAKQFQQLATGERALSDPIEADSDKIVPAPVIEEPKKVEEPKVCNQNHEHMIKNTRLITCPTCAMKLR